MIRRWSSDVAGSFTPVLGPRAGGDFMKKSPKYTVMWLVSQASNISSRKANKIASNRQAVQSNVKESEDLIDRKVDSFLYAHPEFVPQRDLVRRTLSYVRNPEFWDYELDELVEHNKSSSLTT